MKDFDESIAIKAIELCFEHLEDSTFSETLDAAKQTYDFMMGESHHFKEKEKDENKEQDLRIKIPIKMPSVTEYLTEYLKINPIYKLEPECNKKSDKQLPEESIVKTRLFYLVGYDKIGRLSAYEDVYGKLNRQFYHLL